MSELRVGSRYAKSLIDLSIERNELELVKKDIDLFLATSKQSSELQAVLRNPIVPIIKKLNIVEGLFGSKVSNTTKSFFRIVISKGRGLALYTAAKEFQEQYNEKNKIITAKVVSASALTESASAALLSTVEKATGKKVLLEQQIDSHLIGGFVLTVGDKQFDASIAKSLSSLKKEFESKQVVA